MFVDATSRPHCQNDFPSDPLQLLHDLRLVWLSEDFQGFPRWIAALASCCVALLEYSIQVTANRIGHQSLSVGQLKMIQEVISLKVFVPFAVFYQRENLSWNYLYDGFCMMGPSGSCSEPEF
jgi:uncharacterized protein (DUF486 family)